MKLQDIRLMFSDDTLYSWEGLEYFLRQPAQLALQLEDNVTFPENFSLRDSIDPFNYYAISFFVDNAMLGAFTAQRRTSVMAEIHANFLPKTNFNCVISMMQAGVIWLLQTKQIVTVTATIPAYHKGACNLARRMGMVLNGISPRCCRKYGQLWSLHHYHLPEDWSPCQVH